MEQNPTLLDCAHSIIAVVPRLSRLMRKDLRLHSEGLFTEPQFRVMARLYREGPQCLSALADLQGVSLPTMSKLVQGLEARALVERERDEVDHRRIVLALTPVGRSAYEDLLHCTEQHIVDWISTMTPEDRSQVIHALEQLDRLFSQVTLTSACEAEASGN
ncbi:MAG: MarR family winged helix-turn-helix transcriptional regulator [Anaerolineae bacterium]|jgi:DNA-binding MarR family transcriptional regulator|nr:MarR family winged helix-turn-helix transcriptional regulator [Anaerolineae bacterium]